MIIGGIVVILIVRLAVGYWASKKVQMTNDYVLAGRRLPISMVAPSIMAIWFAAETLMGSSSEAYKYGLQGAIGMYRKKSNRIGALTLFFSGAISWVALSLFYYNAPEYSSSVGNEPVRLTRRRFGK